MAIAKEKTTNGMDFLGPSRLSQEKIKSFTSSLGFHMTHQTNTGVLKPIMNMNMSTAQAQKTIAPLTLS